jgi:hypothetical protein
MTFAPSAKVKTDKNSKKIGNPFQDHPKKMDWSESRHLFFERKPIISERWLSRF